MLDEFMTASNSEYARRQDLFDLYSSLLPHDAKFGQRSWDIKTRPDLEFRIRWQDDTWNPEGGRYGKSFFTYEAWLDHKAPFGVDDDGKAHESKYANPDLIEDKPEIVAEPHRPAERILLDEALETLTVSQRKVWRYRLVKSFTQEETAKRLGVSQPVVAKTELAATRKVVNYLNENKGRIS